MRKTLIFTIFQPSIQCRDGELLSPFLCIFVFTCSTFYIALIQATIADTAKKDLPLVRDAERESKLGLI
ncbi:MAG: hypothetical protein EZS28_026870, partial [Streblomastix strix]